MQQLDSTPLACSFLFAPTPTHRTPWTGQQFENVSWPGPPSCATATPTAELPFQPPSLASAAVSFRRGSRSGGAFATFSSHLSSGTQTLVVSSSLEHVLWLFVYVASSDCRIWAHSLHVDGVLDDVERYVAMSVVRGKKCKADAITCPLSLFPAHVSPEKASTSCTPWRTDTDRRLRCLYKYAMTLSFPPNPTSLARSKGHPTSERPCTYLSCGTPARGQRTDRTISFRAGLEVGWCKDPDRGLPAPDKIFFLDISVEDAMKVCTSFD